MKRTLFVLFLTPVILFAQEGVHFQSGLNWQQIKEKAKAENKYIFVDCFATWCGPCMQMDNKVYPVDSVGEFINSHFLSVRVQCDTSKNDSETVKSWYADAHEILSTYPISVYPTFLFLSPDGKLVHTGIGYQDPGAFLALGRDAIDPRRQYYQLLERYRQGTKDYPAMYYLANTAQKLGEPEVAHSIAADYIHNYLEKLADEAFLTKENITFIATYPDMLDLKSRLFDLTLHQSATVNTLLHDSGFSARVVNYVISKDEINPTLEAAKKNGVAPDWEAMSKTFQQKFGSAYVEDNVFMARIRWYLRIQDWKNYTKYVIEKNEYDHIEEHLPKDVMGLNMVNGIAWDIFQHSNNKEELEKAARWSDLVLARLGPQSGPVYAQCIDTKANLLYKLGRKAEALALEAKASELAANDKGVQDTYQKMKEGKPTW